MSRGKDTTAGVLSLLVGGVVAAATACDAPGYGIEPVRPDRTVTFSAYTAELPPTTPPARSAPPKRVAEVPKAAPTPAASSAPVASASAPKAPESPCPPEMALVEGKYCTLAHQICERWLDEGSEFLPRHRCAKFKPSTCRGDRVEKRFCIDRDEYTPPGKQLPANYQSWTSASATCRSLGKRLCTESEWNFACEGEEMRPYPYGYERDASICNFDLTDLMNDKGKLKDLRKPSALLTKCTSPFGVRNMVGNVDEWVFREGGMLPPFRSALKGGWWMAARNRCRPATTAHDEHYKDTQTGFRCCMDVPR